RSRFFCNRPLRGRAPGPQTPATEDRNALKKWFQEPLFQPREGSGGGVLETVSNTRVHTTKKGECDAGAESFPGSGWQSRHVGGGGPEAGPESESGGVRDSGL